MNKSLIEFQGKLSYFNFIFIFIISSVFISFIYFLDFDNSITSHSILWISTLCFIYLKNYSLDDLNKFKLYKNMGLSNKDIYKLKLRSNLYSILFINFIIICLVIISIIYLSTLFYMLCYIFQILYFNFHILFKINNLSLLDNDNKLTNTNDNLMSNEKLISSCDFLFILFISIYYILIVFSIYSAVFSTVVNIDDYYSIYSIIIGLCLVILAFRFRKYYNVIIKNEEKYDYNI